MCAVLTVIIAADLLSQEFYLKSQGMKRLLSSFYSMTLWPAHVAFSGNTGKHKGVPDMDVSGNSTLVLEALEVFSTFVEIVL